MVMYYGASSFAAVQRCSGAGGGPKPSHCFHFPRRRSVSKSLCHVGFGSARSASVGKCSGVPRMRLPP
eukprot:9173854-Lingulodinium_polyedra.AAC.1